MQSVWRDQDRKPRGMANFSRWRISAKQMQDVDGLVHNKSNNHFVMIEFKPAGHRLTVGQEITLDGFGKLPGCTGLCIFEYEHMDEGDSPFDQDEYYKVVWFEDGKQDRGWMRLSDINKAIDGKLGI